LTRPISTREFALYCLGESGPSLPFSAACYSKYKYGSVSAPETFASALGAAFADRYPDLARAPKLLMTSSPYNYVPTAATSLARWLRPVLNAARARHGLPPVPLVQVDRIGTSAGDYGTLSVEARQQLMATNVVSFRRFRSAALRGAHLLFVDDVRVTGAHQRCLADASEELPLAGRTFLYIASFADATIGSFDPTQEDRLNHAAVRSLDDLGEIVERGDFTWNVRACKFILAPSNRDDLPRFLAGMPRSFVRHLHRNSLGDGYARMDLYAPSHAIVDAELSRRLPVHG
jgi:hypothetical protein